MLMHALQQQQAAINKLQLQMAAFMASYACSNNYAPIGSTNLSLQPYPNTLPYIQPPFVALKQEHVFSNYNGPAVTDTNDDGGGRAEQHNGKKSRKSTKKSGSKCNSNNNPPPPPPLNFHPTTTPLFMNNSVPLSPPMEEDCVNQFLVDDYPLIDHNDDSSLLLGPMLSASHNSFELDHAAMLERIFGGISTGFGCPT